MEKHAAKYMVYLIDITVLWYFLTYGMSRNIIEYIEPCLAVFDFQAKNICNI